GQRDGPLGVQAREQAQRAAALVDNGPVDPALATRVRALLDELDQEEKDRKLLAALDAARIIHEESDVRDPRLPFERSVPLCQAPLRQYGLRVGGGPARAAADKIRHRPAAVRDTLAAVLDEWVRLLEWPFPRLDRGHLPWLRALVQEVDPNSWRQQV